jgi:hypothetical protein
MSSPRDRPGRPRPRAQHRRIVALLSPLSDGGTRSQNNAAIETSPDDLATPRRDSLRSNPRWRGTESIARRKLRTRISGPGREGRSVRCSPCSRPQQLTIPAEFPSAKPNDRPEFSVPFARM